MSITDTLSDTLKAKFRKVKKTIPVAVKAAIYSGCISHGAYVQFILDVRVYGLYEALLFLEGYEDEGYFAKGTAAQAAGLLKA